MRALTALFAMLMALCVPFSARADPADIAAASRSVVRVVLIATGEESYQMAGHGSGVAIAPNLVLTNFHVVRQAQENEGVRVGVVPSQGKGGSFARIVAVSPGNDLALLRLDDAITLPAATLFTGAVADGEEVFAVGYPGNVDLAQGLEVADMISPTTPVKTRGNVSAGRSSRQFDSILHTAPIGAGNSGGPLLDACGRVIGVNSFGTLSDSGDSEFYFAVSTREIVRFLGGAKVKSQTAGTTCRSIAELEREEAERLAGRKALTDEQARTLAQRREAAIRKAERKAQFEIMAERENGMALAGIAILLALVSGGAASFLARQGKGRETRIAGAVAMVLLIGAAAAWLIRPSFDEMVDRAERMARELDLPGKGVAPASYGSTTTGDYVCVLDPKRSRITVSQATDVPLSWRADGCVNGRSQYGKAEEGWRRVLVPDRDDTATVARFDPHTATYRADHYLLDAAAMAKLRVNRAGIKAPACGSGEPAVRELGKAEAALLALLPPRPIERLTYDCRREPGGN